MHAFLLGQYRLTAHGVQRPLKHLNEGKRDHSIDLTEHRTLFLRSLAGRVWVKAEGRGSENALKAC